jgi:hypothetical protein
MSRGFDGSEKNTTLALNQVRAQEKLRNWLKNCDEGAALVWDDQRSRDNEMHFYAYDEDSFENGDNEKTQPPEISDAMWVATKQLGCAFQFYMRDDCLHIVVRGPDASEARKLIDKFTQQQQILMSITWDIRFCVFGIILFFSLFSYAISMLHLHWHGYDSPWESMFETSFQIFIYWGDVLRTSSRWLLSNFFGPKSPV